MKYEDVTPIGGRAERVLRTRLPGLPRRVREQLFREKRVRVNGLAVRKGDPVAPGDALAVDLPGPLSPFPVAETCFPLQVRFEDESLLVVEKPGAVHTHPQSPFETGTLANVLVCHYPEILGVGTKPLEPGLVHRLDRGTSGLVAVARTQGVWEQLKKDLAARRWQKIYQGLVHGRLDRPRTINLPLAHDPSDPRRMKTAADRSSCRGRRYQALTEVKPLASYSDCTLVEINLITGVTHQIRVHLAHLGHPIVGDRLYAKNKGLPLNEGPDRLFLHASRLSLPHPVTRETLAVEGSPLDIIGEI